jgi:hypothetical protein
MNRRWDVLDSDEASETSSICSERSYASSLGGLRINEIKVRMKCVFTSNLTQNKMFFFRSGPEGLE